MPYVLQFNKPAVEESFVALGRYLDLKDASVNGVTDWVQDYPLFFYRTNY